MHLTTDQQAAIANFVPIFQQYLTSVESDADLKHRQERHKLYMQLLSDSALDQMSELELGQVISSLWANRGWGNKGYLVDQLIQKNGLPKIRDALKMLLWSDSPVSQRYDRFRAQIIGLGPSSITEILAFVHPNQCGLWNAKARAALEVLSFDSTFPVLRKYQIVRKRVSIIQ
jgi:hypothetical protein